MKIQDLLTLWTYGSEMNSSRLHSFHFFYVKDAAAGAGLLMEILCGSMMEVLLLDALGRLEKFPGTQRLGTLS